MAFANARNIALRDLSLIKIHGDSNTYNAQGDIILDASSSESGEYQFAIQLNPADDLQISRGFTKKAQRVPLTIH